MKVALPDMSGPPVWWDALVLGLAVAGLVAGVTRFLSRPRLSLPIGG